MIYTANITTPKNTAETNLKRTRIVVTHGLVYRVEFYFPAGSAGLMGLAVFDGLFQVWPSSVGEFFRGDDLRIGFDDMYLMEDAPFEFQVYSYNTDASYDHFAAVRIGLVSNEVFVTRFLPTMSQEYLAGLLGEMGEERDAQARLQREELESTVFEWMLVQQRREDRKQRRAEKQERLESVKGREFEKVIAPAEKKKAAKKPPAKEKKDVEKRPEKEKKDVKKPSAKEKKDVRKPSAKDKKDAKNGPVEGKVKGVWIEVDKKG